jgi:phospholipid/cholesterol/gamma-HCH transport system substrate-binding protein
MKKLELELKVGLFVTIGVGLIMAGILVLGSTESLMQRKFHFVAHLPTAEGLISGAKVVLGGIPVGTIESMHFDGERHEVDVKFSVERDSAQWLRTDSSMEVLTQGVLGDKYVSLNAGSKDQPEIPDGGEVAFRASKDLTQFLSKGDQLLLTLNSIATDMDRVMHALEKDNRAEIMFSSMSQAAKNFAQVSDKLNKQMDGLPLNSAVKNLNGILEKINHGNGTLGAFVNDPQLYDSMKSLVGGANRNRVIRNLVRQSVEKGMADEEAAAPKK